MKKMKIYTITTLLKEQPHNGATIAWYSNRDAALQDIETNAGDMHECYFSYIILEEVEEGVGCIAKQLAWFEWEDGFWIECDKPKVFDGVVNWSIG